MASQGAFKFLAFWFVCMGSVAAGLAIFNSGQQERDVPKEISNVAQYDDYCGQEGNNQREKCRKALKVFQHSYLWVDSRLLVPEGEELQPEHLDSLYNFSKDHAEAGRLSVSSILGSWCHKRGSPLHTFEDLRRSGCLQYLPTLAETGLEDDPTLADIRIVDSTYDGSTKVEPLPAPKTVAGSTP